MTFSDRVAGCLLGGGALGDAIGGPNENAPAFAALNPDDVEEIIKAGGDTDSIASIADQICGGYVGHELLPVDWLKRLPESEQIMSVVDLFCRYLTDDELRRTKRRTKTPKTN